MGYPDRESEKNIIRNNAGAPAVDSVPPTMDATDVLAMQDAVSQM